MSEPEAKRPEWQDDWSFRPTKPHWTAEALPAGDFAWTDYANGERLLTRRHTHEKARQVFVPEPLAEGQRVTITPDPAGDRYLARRDG